MSIPFENIQVWLDAHGRFTDAASMSNENGNTCACLIAGWYVVTVFTTDFNRSGL